MLFGGVGGMSAYGPNSAEFTSRREHCLEFVSDLCVLSDKRFHAFDGLFARDFDFLHLDLEEQ